MKGNKNSGLKVSMAMIGLLTLLLTSCGDDNKTNSATNLSSNNSGNFQDFSSQTGNANLPGDVQEKINQVKSYYTCPNGQRLQDRYLNVSSGSITNTSVSGPFQGGLIGGSASTTFAGVMPQTLDLVFVVKMTSGSQTAYNFIVSFCGDNGNYGTGIFDQTTEFNNFQIVKPFNLDADASCSVGNIDQGEISFSYRNQYVNSSSLISVSKVCYQ